MALCNERLCVMNDPWFLATKNVCIMDLQFQQLSLEIVPSAPTTTDITVNLIFHFLVSFVASIFVCLFFVFCLLVFSRFLSFSHGVPQEQQNPPDEEFLDWMIRLYLKVSVIVMRFLFQNKFWFLNISFGSMVKF